MIVKNRRSLLLRLFMAVLISISIVSIYNIQVVAEDDPTVTGSGGVIDCTTTDGDPGIKTSLPLIGSDNCVPKGTGGSIESNPIVIMMKLVLQVASAGVGLVVAVMIIVAGIQYSSAQGNPQLIQAAKQRLMNAIIGLVMYIFAFALLNYLVPGGLIS